MRMRATPENVVTASTIRATADRLDWYRNPSGNATMPSGVKMRFGLGGELGTPDWLAVERRNGRAWFVEFKAPGNKPDMVKVGKDIDAGNYCPGPCRHDRCHVVHQELCLRRARAAGAVGIFADCIADVERELSR